MWSHTAGHKWRMPQSHFCSSHTELQAWGFLYWALLFCIFSHGWCWWACLLFRGVIYNRCLCTKQDWKRHTPRHMHKLSSVLKWECAHLYLSSYPVFHLAQMIATVSGLPHPEMSFENGSFIGEHYLFFYVLLRWTWPALWWGHIMRILSVMMYERCHWLYFQTLIINKVREKFTQAVKICWLRWLETRA